MNFSNYPVLKILIPFIIGIILAFLEIFPPVKGWLWLWLITGILSISGYLFYKLNYNWQKFTVILMQCCVLSIGFLSTQYRYYPQYNDESSHLIMQSNHFIIKILDDPVEKTNSINCIASVEANDQGKSIDEKSVVYFSKNKYSQQIRFGDLLLVNAKFTGIEPPVNPDSFDYRQYMRRKGIYFRTYIPEGRFTVIGHTHDHPVRRSAYRLRQYFSAQFSGSGLSGDEYSVITAILLGNDETLDPALRASYSSAGVSHILCVSGMHVGIIFMILNFLLRPLQKNNKTKIIKAVILLLVIWFYAHLTGLSPSVQRASAMFTFVSIGGLIKRTTTVFHSLFTSLFILLALNPLLLFELGFQLSYLAVFSIVIFQKPIFSVWNPRNRIIRYCWELATVSVSAQIGTFPVAIYHFGQFPNYFLLGNLFVIILSFIIVVSGIVLLSVSFSSVLAGWAGNILTFEIKFMNGIITTIENLPGAVSDFLYLGTAQVLLIYGIIGSLFILITRHDKKWFWSMIIMSILFLFLSIHHVNRSREISVNIYAVKNKTAINFNHCGKSILLHNFMEDKKDSDYQFSIYPHERLMKIKSELSWIQEDSFYEDIGFYKMENFLRFHQLTFYMLSGNDKLYPMKVLTKIDYLYIRDNAKIVPELVARIFNFDHVIVDQSVGFFYENRWREFCLEKDIKFYSVRESGFLYIPVI